MFQDDTIQYLFYTFCTHCRTEIPCMRLNIPIQPSSRVFGISFLVRSSPVHRHGVGFEELIMANLHGSLGVGCTFEMFCVS